MVVGADLQPQEMALRALIQFYNKRHHSAHLAPPHSGETAHRRSNSVSAVTLDDPAIHHRGSVSAGESDVFPPRRTDLMPYNPDGMIEFWLHEYEDVLSEVFGETLTLGPGGEEAEEDGEPATVGPGDDAWKRLGEIMRGGRDEDEISDSESVVSVGELGEEARMDGVMGVSEAKEGHQGENTWEVSTGCVTRSRKLIHSTCRQRLCCSYPAPRLNGAVRRRLDHWVVHYVLSCRRI